MQRLAPRWFVARDAQASSGTRAEIRQARELEGSHGAMGRDSPPAMIHSRVLAFRFARERRT